MLKPTKWTLISTIVTSLCVPFFFNGCVEDSSTYPMYYLSEDISQYCEFDNGSWWIYENMANGVRDTVTVSKHEHTWFGPDKNVSYQVEVISQDQKSSLHELLFPDYQYTNNYITATQDSVAFTEFISVIGVVDATTDVLYFSGNDSNQSTKYGNSIRFLEWKDTTRINGIIYSDIKVFEIDSGLYSPFISKVYWARNIGQIYYERSDGTKWNLINYSVKQP